MRSFIPASIYRGGTSNAVLFNASDLPNDRSLWPELFLHIMGSPDEYGRQLDGLGGGLSSLSKVVVVAPSDQDHVDLDYTFFQVSVDQPIVDEGAMCGNMASSVGPFAVERGLLTGCSDGTVRVRVCNTNTNKLFEVEFEVSDGQVVEVGDFAVPGVSGTGAPICLRFLDPGGSRTGALLPTGQSRDRLALPTGKEVDASLVDASNPVVFVRADDFGLNGNESAEAIEADTELMQTLDAIRRAGSVAMGLSKHPETANLANPKIALVATPQRFQATNGTTFEPNDMDVAIRIISMEKVHRAVTLTGGMCLATALKMQGFVLPLELPNGSVVRIAHPSGVFPVEVHGEFETDPSVNALTCYRTQRCLMQGFAPVPNNLLRRDR